MKERVAKLDWRYEALLLIGLTLLGAALRFYALDHFPPGLYHDEAYNGLDALRVLDGARPVFFSANNGREPLFIYGVAASISLWGRSPGAIRFVAALIGTLTVPASYLMAHAMIDRRVGLWTAALMAITFWPLNLSRLGFRVITMPLITALALWALWSALRRPTWGRWALAGALCGLGLYTYLAFRLTAPLWALALCYAVWIRHPRTDWRHVVAYVAAALVVAAPLLAYGMTHPDAFLQRTGQLSIWTLNPEQPWRAVLTQTAKSGLMFLWRGDFIPRHNLPLRPVFDIIIAPFFLLGVGVAVWWAKSWRSQGFVLLWTGVMLLPTILAEGAPHFVRAAGVLPVVMILPAVGLDWAARRLAKHHQLLGHVALVVLVAISGIWTARDYFVQHGPSEAAYFNFETGAMELAQEINRFLGSGWRGGLAAKETPGAPDSQAFISQRLWENWSSIRYLVSSPRLETWSQERLPVASDANEVMLICWPFDDYQDALGILSRDNSPGRLIDVREGALERGDLETEPRLLYLSFSARGQAASAPRNLAQRYAPGLILLGYDYQLDGSALTLMLYWQRTGKMPANTTVFVQAWRGTDLLGQDDGPPCSGYYPLDRWATNDVVIDRHMISLDAPWDETQDQLVVGLYLPDTMERLQRVDEAGHPLGDHIALPIASERSIR